MTRRKKLLTAALAALILLISFCTAFLYLPAPKSEEEDFDRAALEDALLEAREDLSRNEGDLLLREKVLFYESIRQFDLFPWDTPFATEGASAYARLLLREEAGGEALSEEKSLLADVLQKRDGERLASFLTEEKSGEGAFSREDLAKQKEEKLLLFSAPDAATPGQSALFYEISLLKQSLREDRDFFSGTESPLSPKQKARYEALLEIRTDQYLAGDSDPVPANEKTLWTGEKITALLTLLFLFYVLGQSGDGDTLSRRGIARRLVFHLGLFLLLTFLSALVLFFATLFSAPGTVRRVLMPWGEGYISIPFFLGLFCRLLCRGASDLPVLFLAHLLIQRKRGRTWLKILAFLPILRYVFTSIPVPVIPQSVFTFLSAFCPELALFPDLSPYAPRLAPLSLSLPLLLLETGLILFFLFRKGKKESPVTA